MTFFARLSCCFIFMFSMNFSAFATTLQYVQSVEIEIIKSISATFEKEVLAESELKISFSKKILSPTPTKEKTTPIEIELPKLVIDDVIVMLNDIPLEIELLSFHSVTMPSSNRSFLPNQCPG